MSLQWWQYEGLWKVFLQKLWPCCTGCGVCSVVVEPVICTDAIMLFPSSHRTSQIFSPWTKRTSRTTHLTFTVVGLCDIETVRVHIAAAFCRCCSRQLKLHDVDSDTAYGAFLDDFVSRSTQLTITETDEESRTTIRFPNSGWFCANAPLPKRRSVTSGRASILSCDVAGDSVQSWIVPVSRGDVVKAFVKSDDGMRWQ